MLCSLLVGLILGLSFFSGYSGQNIPVDLLMEHLNNYLKETLRGLHGNVDEKNADRVAKALITPK